MQKRLVDFNQTFFAYMSNSQLVGSTRTSPGRQSAILKLTYFSKPRLGFTSGALKDTSLVSHHNCRCLWSNVLELFFLIHCFFR